MLRFFHHLQAVQELQEIPRAVCCEFSNFDAESDAKALKKAVEGLGKIFNILFQNYLVFG